MTDFIKKPINIKRLMADGVSPGCRIVQIRLTLVDRQKRVIFNL